MKKTLYILVLLAFIAFPESIFSQQTSDELYAELDAFVALPSKENLAILEVKTSLFEKNAQSSDDYLALVISKTNIGYYQQQFGSLSQSILSYESAWSLFEKYNLSSYGIYENCLLPLSKIYTQQGDFLKAEELLKRCYIQAGTTKNSRLLAQISISISALYNTLGKYNAAIKFIEKALLEKNKSIETKYQLENNLAASYIGIKNYTKAKEVLLEIVKNRKSANSFKSLAFIALKENNLNLANDYFKEAEVALKNQVHFSGRDFILLAIEKSELLLASGKSTEAQEELQRALRMILPTYKGTTLPKKNALIADRNLVRIFDIYAETINTTEDKLQVYDLSFYVENLLVNNYTSQETKIIHQTDHKRRTEKCIDLLWIALIEHKNAQYVQRAFQYAEDSKASVLLKKMVQNNSNDADQEVRELYAKREKLTDDLLRIQFKQLGDLKADEIVAEIQALDRAISSLNTNQSVVQSQTIIDFDLLKQRVKNDNATLVSYFSGKEYIYQFIVTKDVIALKRISATADFNLKISNFIPLFDNPNRINNDVLKFTKTAYQTFQALHLEDLKNQPNLIVIPDGLLNFLPFESLLTGESTSLSFSEMPFLVKEKSVAYAYNLYDYVNKSEALKDLSILGVFPVFENTAQALNYSITEAEAIENQFKTTSLFKMDATKSNFLKQSNNASLLHLSTHAGSGNFIVPANIQFIDDVLYLPELYSLNMTGKTVVLSACETGIGKLQSGEGAISIARGFKYAGAEKVLFTLWEVNDKSTSEVMAAFYKELKNSNSVFEANHKSKLDYLNNPIISNHKKSPYYWNSFTYYGAIDTPEKGFNYWWLFYGFLGVLGLLMVLKLFRKKKIVH